MTEATPHVDVRLSKLEARVEGIVGTLQGVVDAVTGLGEKLDKKSQPQWSVYISAGAFMFGVLGFVGTAWKSPIETALLRQERDIGVLQSNIVTRAEHEVHWKGQERLYDYQRDRIGRVEARFDKRLERLEAEHFKPGG